MIKKAKLINKSEGMKCYVLDENKKIFESYYISNGVQIINFDKFQSLIDSGVPIEYFGFSRLMLANLYKMFDCTICTSNDYHYIFRKSKNNNNIISKIVVIEETFQQPFFIFVNSDGSKEALEFTVEAMNKVAYCLKKGIRIELFTKSRLCCAKVQIMLNELSKSLKENNQINQPEEIKKQKVKILDKLRNLIGIKTNEK